MKKHTQILAGDLFDAEKNSALAVLTLLKVLVGTRFLGGDIPPTGALEQCAANLGDGLDRIATAITQQTRAIQDLTTCLHEEVMERRGAEKELQETLEELTDNVATLQGNKDLKEGLQELNDTVAALQGEFTLFSSATQEFYATQKEKTTD